MQLQRLEWIDITKGFAIILMVFGHSSIPKAYQIIYGLFTCHFFL